VRRGVKVVVWTLVFAGCAGAGAFVAAHTNPFPPGVEDPGARPTTPVPTSPAPTNERWSLVMSSATRHELHVGGSCRSDWRTTGSITIDPVGRVTGNAQARLRAWSCDFPVAQVQTRIVRLHVSGTRSDERIELRFEVADSAPTGSQDLGGFVPTVEVLRPDGDIAGGHVGVAASATRPDGDLGRYVNQGEIQLDCATGC